MKLDKKKTESEGKINTWKRNCNLNIESLKKLVK